MRKMRFWEIFLASAVFTAAASAEEATVDFQRDVRPVLSDTCFQCHGPDPQTRMAGLRLDLQEGVFAQRPNGVPVVAGNAGDSLVYQRITDSDTARRMPPEYSHKELTPEQIETIRRWIDEGAEWSEHWAFRTPTSPPLPHVRQDSWVRNPIDRFILARLEREGLQPAPEADRSTLARRVSLDLTGLPPSPEVVGAFVDDDSPAAYEKLIDRYLASKAYGEHRARYWLDAARYADTHGLHIDNYREMWPYRDWVIDAFNRNMKFDQFTIEQLAGDLLPEPTQDQLVATGFQRCNITTNEGGVIEEEVAEMYAKDRAETLATVWLGLTVGCATCHDHKFDPLTQRDFYSLGAFFRNTEQPVMDGNVHDTPPIMLVLNKDDESAWNSLKEQIADTHQKLERLEGDAKKDAWKHMRSRKVRRSLALDRFDDSEVFSLERYAADHAQPKGISPAEGPFKRIPALDLAEESFVEVAGFDAVSADKPFTISAWFRSRDDERLLLAGQIEYVDAEPNYDERGWRIDFAGGRPSMTLIGDLEFELAVQGTKESKVEGEGWHHLVASYDGSRRRSGFALYVDGKPVATRSSGRAIHELEGEIRRPVPLTIGGMRNNENRVVDDLNGGVADLRILSREVSATEARLLYLWAPLRTSAGKKARKLTPVEREALETFYAVRRHEPYRAEMARLAVLETERRQIQARNPLTHVMYEKTDSDPMAHVLYRGMYDQPREQVGAVTPAVLPPMSASLPKNRLGLAHWLLDEANPLTARVTANRMWQEVFGSGIVRTAEDFGSQGEAPSHPGLLDWLAVDLQESGWDLKRFYKQLLMSAAYRQSAESTPEKIAKDRQNRLLSRGPRFRMDGEVLRDYALSASGLLNHRIGGPSVKPYQPDGVWEGVAMRQSNTRFYEPDEGDHLYRRSLYTFWKRAAPPPAMLAFDAPTREHCTVRRERTNTPLQALVTMNDPQFFEAARGLAEAARRAATNLDGRLDFIASRLLARPLEERERAIVDESYRDFLRFYDARPEDARSMLSVGESEPDLSGGTAELAALTMVANQLMNLDEVLSK